MAALKVPVIAFLIAAATCGVASAGSLRKLWEVNLKKAAAGEGIDQTADLPVLALRFSPDGGKIAVVAGVSRDETGDHAVSNLLLLDTAGPSPKATRFALPFSIDETEFGGPLNNFQWSPDGKLIDVGGIVIRLEDHKTCRVPFIGGFTSEDRVITYDPDAKDFLNAGKRPSHFLVFDAACTLTGKWTAPEDWYIRDSSPDRGLLLVGRHLPDRYPLEFETLVVNAIDRTVMGRWPGDEVWATRFADSGRAICGGRNADKADRVPVICWNADTGQPIGTAPTVNGGTSFATAARASRMVASDYRRSRIPFSYEYRETLKQRVVWDFGTGKELVSWYPDKQEYLDRVLRVPRRTTDFFRCAMSPDGQYIVEGGSGLLRLYKIEP